MGLSASSEDKELLAWDVQNRTDITELISTRKEARHPRRNRKTRYRAPCFNAGNLNAKPLEQCLYLKKIRRHNRQIHKFNFIKGHKRKSNQTDHMVGGFCLFDKVKFEGQECLITGRRKSGSFVLKTLSGQKIHSSASMRKLVLIERANGY